ncbi:MAG: tetratricopeptide repeat protein [Chitinophagaceae bacterium]|nr:tetratricopeptide repeat protein [Chitinophagaceae bacterium]
MKKILLLLTVSTFCSILLPAQKVKDLLSSARTFAEQKKYDEAVSVLKKAKAIDSANYNVIIGLSEMYYELQQWQDCYDELSAGILLYPDSPFLYFSRAEMLYTTVNTDAAIADYTTTLKMVDADSLILGCLLNRGACYSQKREFQLAYEDYTKASLIAGDNTAILNNMATALDELGRADDAILILKKIITLDSTFLGSYVNLGFQYTKLGRYKEAIEYFDKAIELDKKEPLTYNNRGLARYHLGDHNGALADINESLRIYPQNSYAYKNRALVYLALKEKEKACADIQKALELGFTKMYGEEVLQLKKANCDKTTN